MGIEVEKKAKEILKKHKIVGLDTMIFIYHFEANKKYSALTKMLFDYIQEGKLKAVTSSVSLMGILVKPIKVGNLIAARDYELIMTNYPNLTLIALDNRVALKGAMIRGKYNLRMPDAIQIASSLTGSATAFITNDLKFEKVKELDIIILDKLCE